MGRRIRPLDLQDFVEFEAAAGELQITIEKIHLAVHGCTRTLDLLLLTGDLAYEPQVTDTAPLYVKIRMLPEQKQPVVVHFWGRRPFSPWYTAHANINRKGIFLGIGTGARTSPASAWPPEKKARGSRFRPTWPTAA